MEETMEKGGSGRAESSPAFAELTAAWQSLTLEPMALALLADHLSVRTLAPGERLLTQGTVAPGVSVLTSGRLAVRVDADDRDDGREELLLEGDSSRRLDSTSLTP